MRFTEEQMDRIRCNSTAEAFLQSLVADGYLLHGSIYLTDILLPRADSPHGNAEGERSRIGVFATDKASIAMWHGTLNKKLARSLVQASNEENLALCGTECVFGYVPLREDCRFDIDARALNARCGGYVYVLSRYGFQRIVSLWSHEYYTPSAVCPEMVIPVKKTDFPDEKVFVHWRQRPLRLDRLKDLMRADGRVSVDGIIPF
jgi:hypothetical protein